MRVHSLFLAAGIVAAFPASAAVPLNDSIENATVLASSMTSDLSFDVTRATTDPGDLDCGGPIYQSVWFSYTSPVDQFVDAFVSSSTDLDAVAIRPRVAVAEATPDGLSVVDCDADAHEVHIPAKEGETYYLMVYSPVPQVGSAIYLGVKPFAYLGFTKAIPPANDLFWYPEDVTSIPWETVSEISASIRDLAYDPGKGESLWYRYTATKTQSLDALFTQDYPGSAKPSVFVITGTLDSYDTVGTKYQFASDRRAAVRFVAEAGMTYYVSFGTGSETETGVGDVAIYPTPPATSGTVTADSKVLTQRKLANTYPWIWPLEFYTVANGRIDFTCEVPTPEIQFAVTLTQGSNVWETSTVGDCSAGVGTTDFSFRAEPESGPAIVTITGFAFEQNFQFSGAPQAVDVENRFKRR